MEFGSDDTIAIASLQAELDRGDRWHSRLQSALDRTHIAESREENRELSLELRYGVLLPSEFRTELGRELSRTLEARENLAIIDVEIEGELTAPDREALYRGLSVMVDRPGDLIARTESGVRMIFPWSDASTAQSLAGVAAGITAHELPDRETSYGFQLVNGTRQPGPTPMGPVPSRTPTVYRSQQKL